MKAIIERLHQTPRIYGVLYFLLIPVFAAIYYFIQGFADPASFFDAMYFSVVTITTLGYGDIIPHNDAARFIAAAEATLGVLLIGLFLSALAHQRSVELSDKERKNLESAKYLNNLISIRSHASLLNRKLVQYISEIEKFPGVRRDGAKIFTFTVAGLARLYKTSPSFQKGMFRLNVEYYFDAQMELKDGLERLLLFVDLEKFPALETKILTWLDRQQLTDVSEFLLQVPKLDTSSPISTLYEDALLKHVGPIKLTHGNVISPVFVLYWQLHELQYLSLEICSEMDRLDKELKDKERYL